MTWVRGVSLAVQEPRDPKGYKDRRDVLERQEMAEQLVALANPYVLLMYYTVYCKCPLCRSMMSIGERGV